MESYLTRQLRIDGDVAYVPLTKGYWAVIDRADVALVSGFKWTALVSRRADGSVRSVYAKRAQKIDGKIQTILMHRVIAGTPHDLASDHIDGNGLNNRRRNLRNVTTQQNNHNARTPCNNSSGVKGVSVCGATGKWVAMISRDKKQRYLGQFGCRTAAALAYAKASAALHGEYGRVA